VAKAAFFFIYGWAEGLSSRGGWRIKKIFVYFIDFTGRPCYTQAKRTNVQKETHGMSALIDLTPNENQLEESVLTITPVAAAKVRELLIQRDMPNHALRVFVAGGGCSGLSYGMAFESNIQDSDTLVESDGIKVVIDPTSLMYMQGATIDFVDSLMGGGFRIDNPQAVSSCGCGHSFRTKDAAADGGSAGGCGTCSSH
jgi:iron-sulfur cluster assembly protein